MMYISTSNPEVARFQPYLDLSSLQPASILTFLPPSPASSSQPEAVRLRDSQIYKEWEEDRNAHSFV